jgi:hypothetical protein
MISNIITSDSSMTMTETNSIAAEIIAINKQISLTLKIVIAV